MKIRESTVKMLGFIKQETVGTFKVRLGFTVAILYICLFLIGIAMMRPADPDFSGFLDTTVFAGRPFHYSYENFLLKIVVGTSLPVMLFFCLIWWILTLPFQGIIPAIMDRNETSYLVAAVWIVLGALEWWFLWYKIEKSLRRKPSVDKVIGFLHRHQASIIITIISLTAILIPFLNEYCKIKNHGIRFRL